jgi:hypothetical protein
MSQAMRPGLFVVASLLAVSACEPSLPHTQPSSIVTAEFDPTASKIPLPNDLVFLNPINSVCAPPNNTSTNPSGACAQAELLASFAGRFPSDQEVAITIDFAQVNFDASGKQTQVAPDLDFTTFGPTTFFVYGITAAGRGEIAVEPPSAADYAKAADHGTLTLHHKGRAPWEPGSYAVFIRGGDQGVKTVTPAGASDPIPVSASQVFHLVAQGLDMTKAENLGLLRAQTGSTAAAVALGSQLNLLIALYKATAFPFADARFPHEELAILTTFSIAPTVTNVTIDPARGQVPLPIDLLRDATTHKLSALAACTLVGSALAADGTCPNPAAAGFQALDGFSTTGAILAPTSELIQAGTVTADSVKLYDLSDPSAPKLVVADTLIIEPCEFTSDTTPTCTSTTALSPVIAIQPAGATRRSRVDEVPSIARTKPLKDNTDYAVVMTTAIHDKAGNPIGRGTVAKVLGFSNPVSISGKSQLQGIDDATAASLEAMRKQLVPVFALFPDRSQVAMAYTFHTQTILKTALDLVTLPYQPALAAAALPIPETFHTPLSPSDAFTKYGINPAKVRSDHIDEILEVDITTFDLLDPKTGAFNPDPTKIVPTPIHVLIATPKPDNANIPVCKGDLAPLQRCAPLMVFRHGLQGGRADMLAVADVNAAAGMVTVAIDAAKHGDRTLCKSGTIGPPGGCKASVTCMTTLNPPDQGDAQPPGTCGADGLEKRPVMDSAVGATDGIAVHSGQYFISGNFFRTRDSMRQDLIDQSQLIHVMAFAPVAGANHVIFNHIFARSMGLTNHGLAIDPTQVYFMGQSLGAIQGVVDVAANPRITKAVFNVGGGTVVDIFTNSPAFADTSAQLLGGRTGADLLQFLVVAKTILDPADPINFAGHLTHDTLANLLLPPGDPNLGKPQPAKRVLTQFAQCDGVVPNPFSLLLASNIPTGPFPGTPQFGGPGTLQVFATGVPATPTDCTTAVDHTFLTDWKTTLTRKAQSDLSQFVTNDSFFPPGLRTP